MYNTLDDEECNLELLKNPMQKGFLDEIQCAHIYLTPNQINDYFSIVLSHFEKEIPDECGHAILHSLCWVLSNDSNLNQFVDSEKNYPLLLPFSKKGYLDDVFDVLYIIVTRRPEAFNEELIEKFNRKVKSKGLKSLKILSVYSQHFNDINDPYPMLEVLFNNFKRFSQTDVADKYANLLAILVQSYPEFRRDKGKESWSTVCQLLDVIPVSDDDINDKNSKIIKILASIYSSLSIIASYLRFSFHDKNTKSNEKSTQFNFEYPVSHFKYKPLQDSIISFLLVVPLDFSQLKNKQFLKALLDISLENDKATYVLIRLAEDKIISRILIEKFPFWMETNNPVLENTLQLFLVIFQHENLRQLIATQPEFIQLLLNIIDSAKEKKSYLNIACKIIRKIELTDEILDELCASKVISSFMQTVQSYNNSSSANMSGIMLLEKVAMFGFRKELTQNCEWISNVIKSSKDDDTDYVFSAAIDVAAFMARYKKCAKKCQELDLVKFFQKLSNEKQYKRVANSFLSSVKKNDIE